MPAKARKSRPTWYRTTVVHPGKGFSVLADVSVEIDWNKVYRKLGQAAFRNKSGTATCLFGAIKVRAKEVKDDR